MGTEHRESLRTFFAMAVAADRTLLPGPVRGQLHETLSSALRWVPQANWHVTLKFVGATAPDTVPELIALLDRVARSLPDAMTVRALGIGGFPPARPRAVALELDRDPALLAWARALDHGCERLGVAPERRSFRPHVTLARLGRRLSVTHHPVSGALCLRRAVLYRSDLGPRGVRYRPLHAVELSGGEDRDDLDVVLASEHPDSKK